MDGELHRAVSRSAEDRAVTDERSGLVGSESNFSGLPFSGLGVNMEFLNANAMVYINALQYEHDRFAFLYGDLAGGEVESFRGYFNSSRSGLSVGNLNKSRRRCEDRGKDGEGRELPFHYENLIHGLR